MTMTSAPRPVRTRPTEVAIRTPPAVVAKSLTGLRAEGRVGKSALYQSASMIVARKLVRQVLAVVAAMIWTAGLCTLPRSIDG
jgi:hypothetical protein